MDISGFVRRRFGNHSNLTADAAPDRSKKTVAAAEMVTKTNGHSIHKNLQRCSGDEVCVLYIRGVCVRL
jgi:hypothetical protein